MKKRILITFFLMIMVLFAVFLWNLMIGSLDISFSRIVAVLFGDKSDIKAYKVIQSIRLPRILAAMLLGGALALSGFLLQTFFQNPIAGPYVLGISSGAKLFVAIALIFFLDRGIYLSSLGMVSAAFLGSILAMTIVLLFSFRVQNMSVLVVCGILVGYVCSAITDFFITFAKDIHVVNLHNWSVGSFAGIKASDIKIIALLVLVLFLLTYFLSKPIGAFLLGENYARNMGVNVPMLRFFLILISSLLSACVTAFAGPVSFVGIAVPHLVKSAFNTSKPLILIPASFLGGAIITAFCDGIARLLFAPAEVSISSVTAFFLVPVVIYMMIRRRTK